MRSEPDFPQRDDRGGIAFSLAWTSDSNKQTESVAWGDGNGDGWLDLAVGNSNDANRIYWNTGRDDLLDKTAPWETGAEMATHSVAWGDVDNDSFLDLAVSNQNGVNQLYINTDGKITTTARDIGSADDKTFSLAWGDVNGDGWLDLVVGNFGTGTQIFTNTGVSLGTDPAWKSADSNTTTSVAWGDMDGDGDLDLAVGNAVTPNSPGKNQIFVLVSNMVKWEKP